VHGGRTGDDCSDNSSDSRRRGGGGSCDRIGSDGSSVDEAPNLHSLHSMGYVEVECGLLMRAAEPALAANPGSSSDGSGGACLLRGGACAVADGPVSQRDGGGTVADGRVSQLGAPLPYIQDAAVGPAAATEEADCPADGDPETPGVRNVDVDIGDNGNGSVTQILV
jgi:hypothetical protein